MATSDVILATGCSSGFGRLMAEDLARKGYTVFASMRDTAGRNATVSKELGELAKRDGLSLWVVDLDVTDETSVNRAVHAVMDRVGRIDVLVNNAGIAYIGPNEALTMKQVQQQFDTNVFGVARMNRAVAPHMRRRGRGLLLHISSGCGRVVMPFLGMYSASKFALEAVAESYRYDLSSFGVDSVIVEPGAYPTPVWGKLAQPEVWGQMAQPEDRGRVAEYGDVAKIPAQMGASVLDMFAQSDAPDPQEVVDVVAKLIEMPASGAALADGGGARWTGVRRYRQPSGRAGAGGVDGDVGADAFNDDGKVYELHEKSARKNRLGGDVTPCGSIK